MKNVIMTIGAPGSGKSSWAEEYVKQFPEYIIIERDILRKLACKDDGYDINDLLNFQEFYYNLDKGIRSNIEGRVSLAAQEMIALSDNIILSDTNLTPKHRNGKICMLDNMYFNIKYKIFNPDIRTLVYQNSVRVDVVNENIVYDMYLKLQHQKEYLKLMGDVEFITDHDTDTQNFSNTTDRQCIICDLDGTIAHISNDSDKPRTHFQMHRVDEDEFDDIVFSMVLGLKRRYDCDLIFLTGRTADCFSKTIEWLDDNLSQFSMSFDTGDYQLYSRNNHDYSKDFKVKRELYNTFIKDKYEVLAVFDDRPVCLDLWNDLGLKAIAVSDQRVKF